MGGSLPKVGRADGQLSRTVLFSLIGVIVALAAIILALLYGGLLPQGPGSDVERDYAILIDGLRKDPRNPALLMTIAEKEFDLGRTGDAFEHAKQAVKEGGDETGFFLRYAQLLVRDGQTKAAEKALASEIAVSGQTNPESYFLLAQVQAEGKRYKEAIKNMQSGLKLAPEAADMHIIYAEILEQSGDKKRAEREFVLALRYLPENADAVAGLKRLGAKVPTATGSPHGQ